MQTTKTFRLFISSPFSDFSKEREVLHTKVFPKIEEHCTSKGLSFQPVDLRWGVNEEAQLDQKTLEVCLEEVRACKHFPHPNFLIMAGDRYGYVPCPYQIKESEFEKIKSHLNRLDKNNHLKVLHPKANLELLNKWYKLDKNQLPEAAYILQTRVKENDSYKNWTNWKNWEKEENSLRAILQNVANYIFADKNDKEYQKYFLSATEHEVVEGICDYKSKTNSQQECDGKVDKEYVFGYARTISNISDSKHEQIFLDRVGKKPVKELRDKADNFKSDLQTLLGKNLISSKFSSIEDYNSNELKEFEVYITKKLIEAIDKQVPVSKDLTQEKKKKLLLEEEISEQIKFLKDKVQGFQGRASSLKAIEAYIKEDETTQPFVVYGLSGMGKSSLIAKAIQATSDDNKIFRFVGATADSSNIRTFLISIVDELQDKKLIEKVDEYETDSNKFEIQIKEILFSIEKETTIFLDALDQLQHINFLNWLPDTLTSKLKIVLSVLNDEKYNNEKSHEGTHYYERLSEKYSNDDTKFIDIVKDSLEETKESLIINLLKDKGRKLDDYQTNYLLKKWKETNYSPLYLKIAIEEVKRWKDGDKSQTLSDSVEGIISEYLDNLEELYHHEDLLIKKVFGYIHASKDGLSEKELLHILSEDLEDEEKFQKVIINEWHKPIKVENSLTEELLTCKKRIGDVYGLVVESDSYDSEALFNKILKNKDAVEHEIANIFTSFITLSLNGRYMWKLDKFTLNRG